MSGTISDVIALSANAAISHNKMSYKASFKKANGDSIISNYGTIIDKYLPLLKQYTIEWQMTPEEFQQYRYQPKKVSEYLYGTTELWSAIMNINQIYSIAQFNKTTIKVFQEDIMDIIDEIMIKEKEDLEDDTIYEIK